MSISGASLDPSVLRYSEFWTLGVARAAQYCVGHNIKRGWPRCWNTSLLTDTCNYNDNNFSFTKPPRAGVDSQKCITVPQVSNAEIQGSFMVMCVKCRSHAPHTQLFPESDDLFICMNFHLHNKLSNIIVGNSFSHMHIHTAVRI
jgi:hypothetical protein